MLRSWKKERVTQTRDLNTEITSAIGATIEAMVSSTSVSPRKREESSKPIIRALENIFSEKETINGKKSAER